MRLVLGVDGGGTKTHVAVADTSGVVHSFATNGPSNWEEVGLDRAGEALRAAVSKALAGAGAEARDVAGSVFGLAGLDWDSDLPRLEGELAPLGLTGPRRILNDSFIALRAGTSRSWGVVLIAGTGTVAAGHNHAGGTFRTLGLGSMFGDWGSALDISTDAVRAVADAFTGRGPDTTLTDMLCEAQGVSGPADLLEGISRGHHHDEPPPAAPVVLRAAEAGDAVARAIVERAGSGLGRSAALVARKLEMQEDTFEVVLAGGLFRSGSRLLEDAIEVEVRRVAHQASLVPLGAPPVVGAVLTAMEMADTRVVGGVHGRVSAAVTQALRAASEEPSGEEAE